MTSFKEPPKGPKEDIRENGDDFLPTYKAELAVRVLVVLVLCGFAVKNFYVGYLALAAALLVCAAMTGINLFTEFKKRAPLVQLDLLVAAYVLVLLLATACLGVSGALWVFPVVAASRSIGNRNTVVPLTLVLAATIPLIVAYQGDPGNAARLFGALIFTSFYVAYDQIRSERSDTNQQGTGFGLSKGGDSLQRGVHLSRLESQLKRQGDTQAGEVLLLRIANYEEILRDMGTSAAQVMVSRGFEITQSVMGEHVPVYAVKEAEFLIYLEDWSDFEARALGDRLQVRLRASSALQSAAAVVEIGVGTIIDSDNLDLAIAQARMDAAGSAGPFVKAARASTLSRA